MNESTTRRVVTAFKITAWIEALTWIALLTGMYLKRAHGMESAITAPGWAHGLVFIVLVALTVAVAWLRRWNVLTLLLGLLATLLPLCSVIFELWAQRTGKLDRASRSASIGR